VVGSGELPICTNLVCPPPKGVEFAFSAGKAGMKPAEETADCLGFSTKVTLFEAVAE